MLLGKIGYGTVSECLAHGTPLVFVRRDYFNEEPFLRRLLQLHGAAVEIKRRDFLEGTWAPFLLHAAELNFAYKCARRAATYAALHISCNDVQLPAIRSVLHLVPGSTPRALCLPVSRAAVDCMLQLGILCNISQLACIALSHAVLS